MFATKEKKVPARSDAPVSIAPVVPPVMKSEPVAPDVPAAAPVAAPVARPAAVPTNVISRGTSLTGNIETDANLRIEGRMKGDVKGRGVFSVGEGALVEGNINAETAEIAGEVRGQIEVSKLLVLKPTAVVLGDIVTERLVMETGATFNGNIRMGVSPAKPAIEPRPVVPRRVETVAMPSA